MKVLSMNYLNVAASIYIGMLGLARTDLNFVHRPGK